jgi:hypothetical protein
VGDGQSRMTIAIRSQGPGLNPARQIVLNSGRTFVRSLALVSGDAGLVYQRTYPNVHKRHTASPIQEDRRMSQAEGYTLRLGVSEAESAEQSHDHRRPASRAFPGEGDD